MTILDLTKAEPIGYERLVMVIDDHLAQRVLIAWTFYRPALPPILKSKAKPGMTPEDAAVIAWGATKIDFERFERLSGVPSTICEKTFYRLKMANLVYPDGTIAGPSTDLLAGQMRAHVKGLIPRKKHNG